MINTSISEFIFIVLLFVKSNDKAYVFALEVGDVVGWCEGVASFKCYLAAVL